MDSNLPVEPRPEGDEPARDDAQGWDSRPPESGPQFGQDDPVDPQYQAPLGQELPPAPPPPLPGQYGQPGSYGQTGGYGPPGGYPPQNPMGHPPPGPGYPPSGPMYPPPIPPGFQPWPRPVSIPGGVIRDGIVYAPAGFAPRFIAFMLDGIVLYLLGELMIILTGIKTPDLSTSLGSTTPSFGVLLQQMQAMLDSMYLFNLLSMGICAAYFTISHGMFGTTLGKSVLGLRVLRRNGQDLGIPLALLRYIAYFFCAKLIYTAWLIPFNAERRTLYDMLLQVNVYRPLGPIVQPPMDQYDGR